MKESLLEKAHKVEVIVGHGSFFNKLPEADRAEIKELVDAYLAGKLTGEWNARQLYRLVLKPNGYTFSMRQFTDWVSKYGENASTANDSSATKGRESGAGSKVGKRRQHPRTAERGT